MKLNSSFVTKDMPDSQIMVAVGSEGHRLRVGRLVAESERVLSAIHVD